MVPPCTVFVVQYIFLEPLYRTLENIAIPAADFFRERRDGLFRFACQSGNKKAGLHGRSPAGSEALRPILFLRMIDDCAVRTMIVVEAVVYNSID